MKNSEWVWVVRYGGMEPASVIAADEAQATVKAASEWDMEWPKIAGSCTVTRSGRPKQIACARCGGEYYGAAGGLCLNCRRAVKNARYLEPKIRREDRRVRKRDGALL